MSLINNVDAIIKSKKDIDDIGYFDSSISYDDSLKILDINWKTILSEPPKNSSVKTIKELKTISEATKNRTEQELDLVYIVDKEPLELFYKYLAGKKLKFPKSKFFTYYNQVEPYMYVLKYYFNRARPEQLAPHHDVDINVLYTETHHTPAYPSGHTMYAELANLMLSEIYPEHSKQFDKLSEYCGLARILQGVHYPSDNDASKIAISKLYPLIKEKVNERERTQKNPLDRRS